MRQYIFHICLILAFFIGATSTVVAQTVPVSAGLEIYSSIQSPSPGQNIVISAKSYNTDLNSATIVWSVNGSEVKRGIGATTLNTTAPIAGKMSTIIVTAIALDGSRLTGSTVVGSGSVDLIVEADGYVPALFLGKVHPTHENKVKVIAIPHLTQSNGVEYDPATLIYEWRRNESVLQSQSGYGKNSLTIDGSLIPRVFTVSVTIRSRNGDAVVNGLVTISPEPASLAMYIDDPLYGPLFNKALGSQINLGSERESAILGVPFGFNSTQPNDIAYEWMINGSLRQDLLTNQSIIVRAPDDSAGTSLISLKVRNTRNILQSALGGFTVSFSAPREETNPDVTF